MSLDSPVYGNTDTLSYSDQASEDDRQLDWTTDSTPSTPLMRHFPAFSLCLVLVLSSVIACLLWTAGVDRLHFSPAITRVGIRQFLPQYYSSSSCTSNQFLDSLSRARISPTGRSRVMDRAEYNYLLEFQICFAAERSLE
jgi:hypothetical protein